MYPEYNLPPINPAAFGGLAQQGPQSGPPMAPSGGSQGQQMPMDMNRYLIEKVINSRRRTGGGDIGALASLPNPQSQPQQQMPMQIQPQAVRV